MLSYHFFIFAYSTDLSEALRALCEKTIQLTLCALYMHNKKELPFTAALIV